MCVNPLKQKSVDCPSATIRDKLVEFIYKWLSVFSFPAERLNMDLLNNQISLKITIAIRCRCRSCRREMANDSSQRYAHKLVNWCITAAEWICLQMNSKHRWVQVKAIIPALFHAGQDDKRPKDTRNDFWNAWQDLQLNINGRLDISFCWRSIKASFYGL